MPVEVGATTPEPLDVVLTPAQQVPGSIIIDGDAGEPIKNIRVLMSPIDGEFMGAPPQATVGEDRTFTLTVPPGRWRLQVNAPPGYVKSVTLGDQEVSPSALEIGPAPAALKVVIGTKTAQVEA